MCVYVCWTHVSPSTTNSKHLLNYLHLITNNVFSQIVSCGADKTVIVWDVSTGQPVRRLRGHASHVTCIRYNEEATVAVSGSRDNTVMFWDVRSKTYDPIQVGMYFITVYMCMCN